MAHEINNPVGIILWRTDYILATQSDLSAEAKEDLKVVRGQAEKYTIAAHAHLSQSHRLVPDMQRYLAILRAARFMFLGLAEIKLVETCVPRRDENILFYGLEDNEDAR